MEHDLPAFGLFFVLVALGFALRELVRLRRLSDRLWREARTDALTGAGNKRSWRETVDGLQAAGHGFAFVLFDVANLKAMNAALGHELADEVLQEIGASFRASDLAADRIGGDEFALVLPGADVAAAELVRDRVERQVGDRLVAAGVVVFIAGAVGSWAPGRELQSELTAADFELEARKADRKLALGLPVTREETLARVAAA